MTNLLGAFNWYGFLIGSGMIICIVLCYFLLKKRGYNPDIVFDVALICIPMAIIGARLYYIIFDIIGAQGSWSDWFLSGKFLGLVKEDGKIKFRLEGLAIYGGLIFAVIGAVIVRHFNKKKKPLEQMTFMQLLDAFFVLIILGQAIGRWGNYANQEAFGEVVTNPRLQWFPFAVFIQADGLWHYATFFYEFVLNIIGFFVLMWLYYGKRRSYDGFNFAVYCIWYGTGRAFIEGMRTDSLMMAPFRVSQLLSVILIFYGLSSIAFHAYKAKGAGKKVFLFIDKDILSEEYYGYQKTIMYLRKTIKDEPPEQIQQNQQNQDSQQIQQNQEFKEAKGASGFSLKPDEKNNNSEN